MGNNDTDSARIAIIGTGFAGLGIAYRLKAEGIDDFVILERAGDVGGTWRDNTYPGCQCDVPSHLYSFSFAPNPNWSRTYSPQPEIWDYLRECAHRFGLMPYIRFNCEVTETRWAEDRRRWLIKTSQGAEVSAQFLISGSGPLSEPSIPVIPGLEQFKGAAFHSAKWDHSQDLRGKRVAVIGTGASAIQIVPQLQPQVESLYLFQRTPAWVMPHTDRPIRTFERRLYRSLPILQRLVRGFVYFLRELNVPGFMHPKRMWLARWIALRHLRKQVADSGLRARLTPDYVVGCKRILPSNRYYPAVAQPNVELVTESIERVDEAGIVTADGIRHEVDAIVIATGFHVTDIPSARRTWGRDGVRLADVWQGSPEGYLGTAVTGFPNMFILIGPNTGLGHTSMVFMLESQLNYIVDCFKTIAGRRISTLEVRPEVQECYNRELQQRLKGTVWTSGGCSSWYIDSNGKVSTVWPGYTWRFRQRTRHFDLESYITS